MGDEFEVLMSDGFVPCQYQVTPPGTVPIARTAVPQLLWIMGLAGADGDTISVTLTAVLTLQQPVAS